MDSSRKVLFGMLKGNKINQYHLKELLGAGNFGGVFLADEVVRNRVIRQVAIKLIPSDGSDSQLNELSVTTTLKHPHLVEAYAAGDCELLGQEFIYLVLELGKWGLDKRLQQGKLSDLEAKQLITGIAEALFFLHNSDSQKKCIVHRDLKPANILQVGNVWKISDFGIAREMSNALGTLTDRQIGSPAYTPPEGHKAKKNDTQVKVSPAWDMWSFGVMTAEILTGLLPFKDVGDIYEGKAMMPDNLPKPFDRIVQQCLQEDPKARWSAKEILEALNTQPASSLILALPKNQKLELVNIPSGKLVMEGGHEVSINGFRMGKYPVTQAQYEAVMGNNPSYFRANPQCPVETVAWVDALIFCEKLRRQSGEKVRLPSETEWEYACRARTSTRYYFGDNDNDLKDYGWYEENSGRKTHPVGEKRPNGWGLYDMHGNVWEWCADNWIQDVKQLPKDGKAFIGNDDDYSRSIRGGSWYGIDIGCCSALRNSSVGGSLYFAFGFRVVI
jgi:formylglycine-generating enzyme required for sulfatase activity